jgi:hypothetical protein
MKEAKAGSSGSSQLVPLRRHRGTSSYAVAVNSDELRYQMHLRGLTGAELARRARVSPATISHALNGRRIHPTKFRKIAVELQRADPMVGAEALIRRDASAQRH